MKRREAFPSKWLTQDDIGAGERTLTIKKVQIETVGTEEDADEKPVMHFFEVEKGLAVNATNWDVIAELYGDESDHWQNKVITLYVDPTIKFGGKKVGGIRVKGMAAAMAPATVQPNGSSIATSKDQLIELVKWASGMTAATTPEAKEQAKLKGIEMLRGWTGHDSFKAVTEDQAKIVLMLAGVKALQAEREQEGAAVHEPF